MNPFEYAPALESTSIVTIADRYKLFINGKFVAPRSGKYFPTINPATGAASQRMGRSSIDAPSDWKVRLTVACCNAKPN